MSPESTVDLAGYSIAVTNYYFALAVRYTIVDHFDECSILPSYWSQFSVIRQPEKLVEFEGYDIVICEDKFPQVVGVLHALATADVLVCAKSGFSTFAGYINDKLVIEPSGSPHSVPTSVKAAQGEEVDKKVG